MGGRIDTIFMWVKFGDDPISSLDFSFTGGCTLNILQQNVIPTTLGIIWKMSNLKANIFFSN